MKTQTVLPILLCLSLILTLFTMPTHADQPQSIVDATITATYTTGTSLTVTAQLLVHQINDIFGQTYTQQQIESGATGDDIVAIKLRLRDSLNHQLQTTFPTTQITPLGRPTYAIPYFTDQFTINLTDTYFQQPTTNITPLITGLLDLAASITYHYPLASEPGWNTTYHLTLPPQYTLTSATSDQVTTDHHTITWTINNRDGTTPPLPTTLSLHQTTPTTPPNQPQNITIDFTLDTRTPQATSLTTTIQIHTLDLTTYPPLPAFITGITTLPADGLRLLTTNNLLTYDTIQTTTVQPLITHITPLIENSSFNQTLTYTFHWDPTTTTQAQPPYNLTHMDTTPPLNAQYTDPTIHLTIANLTARAYFGLLNAGATATLTPTDLNFGNNLQTLTTPYTITLILPQNITSHNHTTLTWTPTTTTPQPLHSDVQPNPPYTHDKTTILITIDVTNMDLNLPTLFTGRTELTANTHLTEDDNLYILTTPHTIHLPISLAIPYLNADAYRLLHEEGLLTTTDQNTILTTQQAAFETRLTTILNGRTIKALTNTKTYTDSLHWNGDIATMNDLSPIIVSTYADDANPLPATISISPAEFDIAPLHFTLPHPTNASTIYRIIFPAGQTLTSIQAPGETYSHGNTSDGRPYVEFAFNQTNQTFITPVTCYLTASPLYVLTLFLPLILMIVLIVILVIIILLIRKRRKVMPRAPRQKRTKKAKKGGSEEDTGSEDAQDFYVPPAPPSSRKR